MGENGNGCRIFNVLILLTEEAKNTYMLERKNIGKEMAMQKIRQFCSYQERNQQEVRDKLYSYGLYKQDVETLITQMIKENYLNEERYASNFAGGKFRIKHWGKVKIKYELKQKRISDYCIRMALASIDEADYRAGFEKQAETKLASLKNETNKYTRMQKLKAYLLQKGYELNLISEFMHKM